VVFPEELEDVDRVGAHIVPTLEQAFAKIACRCGLLYRFVPGDEGWTLEMTDVERPDRSPEPIHSNYKKPRVVAACWICRGDGNSGEHIAKRSDLKAVFGPVSAQRPLYLGPRLYDRIKFSLP
jgi:hypothetical protein